MRDISKMLVPKSTFLQKHSTSSKIAKNLTGKALNSINSYRCNRHEVAWKPGTVHHDWRDFNFRKNSQNFYFLLCKVNDGGQLEHQVPTTSF